MRVSQEQPQWAVIGRVDMGIGSHFVVLEGFSVDDDGSDVVFIVDGSSQYDVGRTYRLHEHNEARRIFAVNRINLWRLA